MPIFKREWGHYGPLQAAYHRLTKNAELVRYLNAIQNETGRSVATIVADACIEAYAPAQADPRRPKYTVLVRGDHPSTETLDELMRALWHQKRTTGASIAKLVERACFAWIQVHVAYLRPADTRVPYDTVTLHEHLEEIKATPQFKREMAQWRQEQGRNRTGLPEENPTALETMRTERVKYDAEYAALQALTGGT